MKYPNLKIASFLEDPFDKDYAAIEHEIIRNCNAFLETLKLRRELAFYKRLIPIIHSESESLWRNENGSTCPFIHEAKFKFKFRNRDLLCYGKMNADEWREEFTLYELPELRKKHLQQLDKFPTRYPFPEYLKITDNEIIALLSNLNILIDITSGEYNKELGIDSQTHTGLGESLIQDSYIEDLFDVVQHILSNLSLLSEGKVNYNNPGPFNGILKALQTKFPNLKATDFLRLLENKFGYSGGRIRTDNIGNVGEKHRYLTLDILD